MSRPNNTIELITALAVFVALVVVSEILVVPIVLGTISPVYTPWNRVQARQEEMRKQKSYTVLALGDSVGVQSIVPARFTELTGKTMYNYGTYSDRAALTDIYFFLENIKRHGTPEAIITVRSPYSWHEPQKISIFTRQFPHLGISWQLYKNGIMSLSQVMQIAAKVWLPSLFHRHQVAEMRELISSPQRQKENLLDRMAIPGELGYERFDTKRHRAHAAMDEQNWDAMQRMFDDEGIAIIQEDQLLLLQLLCENAAQHGVPLYVTTGPYSTELKTHLSMKDVFKAVEDAIEQTLEEQPLCTYWRKDRTFETKYLSDPTHTLHSGSLIFTEQIAQDFLESERVRMEQ